jgi:phosphatidylserine/phosphatidylglycerophosphate/cardiolipin synthase-like enzyme
MPTITIKRTKNVRKRKYTKSTAPNLNATLLKRTKTGILTFPSVNSVSLVFDSPNRHVRDLLETVPFVQACVCWITSPVLLKALKTRRGVSLIISRGKMATRRKPFYRTLKAIDSAKGAVRAIGSEGKNHSLCHHKFAIGLDARKKPVFLITGSFNWSAQGEKNIENVMVFRDPAFIKAWQAEFNLLWTKSRKYI